MGTMLWNYSHLNLSCTEVLRKIVQQLHYQLQTHISISVHLLHLDFISLTARCTSAVFSLWFGNNTH